MASIGDRPIAEYNRALAINQNGLEPTVVAPVLTQRRATRTAQKPTTRRPIHGMREVAVTDRCEYRKGGEVSLWPEADPGTAQRQGLLLYNRGRRLLMIGDAEAIADHVR
jgi:hypothetical protein